MSNLVVMTGKTHSTPVCVHVDSIISHGTAYMSAMVNFCAREDKTNSISIGYTMRMRGYRIYTTEGEARGRVYSMTPNSNCITGLYQNAEAFPFPIGSSRTVQCH